MCTYYPTEGGTKHAGESGEHLIMNRMRIYSSIYLHIYGPISIFAVRNGGLAQLARALAWQARGHRFDSDNLHSLTSRLCQNDVGGFFYDFIYRCAGRSSKTTIIPAPP